MSEWEEKEFLDCLIPVSIERSKQVQANIYLKVGKYPVVDQGRDLIAGWTNEEATLIENNLPLIIFGDHTRIFKYVDFPFALGADGTKLIKPKQDEFSTRFFYYCLLTLNIPERGYNRHYKLLKEQSIRYPSFAEQQKIAAVLYKIQESIEIQESIIKTTRELKKSTLHHVFTHGLRGEKLKETEIGQIPESWNVGTLEACCCLKNEMCNPNIYDSGVYVGLEHIESGKFSLRYHGSPKEVISAKSKFVCNDILYGKLRPYLDKVVVADGEGICSTDILVLKPEDGIPPFFLVGLLHSDRFIQYANQTTKGLNHPRTSWNSLKHFLTPIPTFEEQKEIAHVFKTVELKIDLHTAKKSALQDLFKTMLNKLMTGEIRVKDLDIDVSEVSS